MTHLMFFLKTIFNNRRGLQMYYAHVGGQGFIAVPSPEPGKPEQLCQALHQAYFFPSAEAAIAAANALGKGLPEITILKRVWG